MTKKILLLTFLGFIFINNVQCQNFNKIYPLVCDADTLIKVENWGISNYLVQNLRPSYDFDNGTYIGCIRLDANGNLIKVFTVNPISASNDRVFIDLINRIWKTRKPNVKPLKDTTDIFIPLKFINSKEFYVDSNLKPQYVQKEIGLVSNTNVPVNPFNINSLSMVTMSPKKMRT